MWWTPAEKKRLFWGDGLWSLQIWHDYSSNKFPWKEWSRSLFWGWFAYLSAGEWHPVNSPEPQPCIPPLMVWISKNPLRQANTTPLGTKGEGQQLSWVSERIWDTFFNHFNLFRRGYMPRSLLHRVDRSALEPRESIWTWQITRDVSTPWADR